MMNNEHRYFYAIVYPMKGYKGLLFFSFLFVCLFFELWAMRNYFFPLLYIDLVNIHKTLT